MRIAFISYEYPPDTAGAGIPTYVQQAATLLSHRGNDVEVFAGSTSRECTSVENGITVHRVNIGSSRDTFGSQIAQVFRSRHLDRAFDVLEGPDFCSEAAIAAQLVPNVPLVVKLHMGMYTVRSIDASTMPRLQKLRVYAGALRRRSRPFWDPRSADFLKERSHILEADQVVAPSAAIAKWMLSVWPLDPVRVCVVPNPYVADASLLRIPVATDSQMVTYIGRLELRKGVLTLGDAVPEFLSRCPGWRVRFVGRSLDSPVGDIRTYLKEKLKRLLDRVEFCDPVPFDKIACVFASSDICVFPSLWENFPNVCLEAMAAGRGIVASKAGGMAEQLDGGRAGLLVAPRKPHHLAQALIELACNREKRHALGMAARQRVVFAYSADVIGPMLEESYRQAMQKHRSRAGASQK